MNFYERQEAARISSLQYIGQAITTSGIIASGRHVTSFPHDAILDHVEALKLPYLSENRKISKTKNNFEDWKQFHSLLKAQDAALGKNNGP